MQKEIPKLGCIRSDDAIRRRAQKRGRTFEEQKAMDLKGAGQAGKKPQSLQAVGGEDGDKGLPRPKKKRRRREDACPDEAVEHDARQLTSHSSGVVAAKPSVPRVRKKGTFAFTSDVSKLESFIVKNGLDARCEKALRRLSDEHVKTVMKRANRTEVDFSKGTHSALISAMCKQVRQACQNVETPAWPEQAGPERVAYNQLLRERYKKHPEALSEVEIERAKVLIARDERKQANKHARLQAPNEIAGQRVARGEDAAKGIGKGRGKHSGKVKDAFKTGRGRGRGFPSSS